MSITVERKQALIKEYGLSESDTGSMEVQCAVLTERIINLTAHLKANHKDFISKRGLLILVGRRRSFLKYLKKKDANRYNQLIEKLKIRK